MSALKEFLILRVSDNPVVRQSLTNRDYQIKEAHNNISKLGNGLIVRQELTMCPCETRCQYVPGHDRIRRL